MTAATVGSPRVKNLLLTGPPGCGKTTAIVRLSERLADLRRVGFYTAELRVDGQREGFRAVTFGGTSCTLAHVDLHTHYRVGHYRVDVIAFERLVLREMARPADVILVDEIGKMECFSQPFMAAMRRCLSGPVPVIATVAQTGSELIAEVKTRADCELWTVEPGRRDALPAALEGWVRGRLGGA